MIPAVIIAKKRDGGTLSDDEIRFLIEGYGQGTIPDYQMSAWAMAVYWRGMDWAETVSLTQAMIDSGEVLRRVDDTARVDKHSTGGLGDKVSLILAPLLACAGYHVPMISGRGLGITGGTLDKLESIPGFRTQLTEREIEQQLSRVGCVICGASESLVPADRKLYALRDVTATVPSIPLITASILSKKIAETLDGLVLDVKYGSGAFMQSIESANSLARSLLTTAAHFDVRPAAILSDMNQPLGEMVGNACEVDESIEILKGEKRNAVRTLTIALGVELIKQLERTIDRDSVQLRLEKLLDSGSAWEKFQQVVRAQGGQLDHARPLAPSHIFEASEDGYIASCDGQLLGQSIIAMGGGRKTAGDAIDPSVGLRMLAKIGDRVARGQPLVMVHCHARELEIVMKFLSQAIRIRQFKPDLTSLFIPVSAELAHGA